MDDGLYLDRVISVDSISSVNPSTWYRNTREMDENLISNKEENYPNGQTNFST